ncbi:imidazole glycerol phosphate synthase hisHF, partial [Phakopsora pachyrhizi]
YLLDYGAGNVRSLANSISQLGFEYNGKLIFPGVGAFGPAMNALRSKGYAESLIEYIKSGKPYMGICIGMQESPDVPGLGIVPAHVAKFDSTRKTVPHMGWNMAVEISHSGLKQGEVRMRYLLAACDVGICLPLNFTPKKSGPAGLLLLKQWLSESPSLFPLHSLSDATDLKPKLSRFRHCLRPEEKNHSVEISTDVREPSSIQETSQKTDAKGQVRNLGKPVDLARRYYQEGADEITFLNITSFRSCPLNDQPMLSVLEKAAESVFVPFCVGGGIRDSTDPDGTQRPALEVATAYFRAGADKVSIGSDAVIASLWKGRPSSFQLTPRRVYVAKVEGDAPLTAPEDSGRVELEPDLGPNGERFLLSLDQLDVVQMAKGVEALGSGEILLNSVDKGWFQVWFDLRLVELVQAPCYNSSDCEFRCWKSRRF